MKLKGGVIINSTDMPKLADWYHNTFKLAFKQNGDKVRCLDLGGPVLVIQSGRETAKTRFALFVDDVDESYTALKSAVKFDGAPSEKTEWGTRWVSGSDPEGNVIDFIQNKTERPVDGGEVPKGRSVEPGKAPRPKTA